MNQDDDLDTRLKVRVFLNYFDEYMRVMIEHRLNPSVDGAIKMSKVKDDLIDRLMELGR